MAVDQTARDKRKAVELPGLVDSNDEALRATPVPKANPTETISVEQLARFSVFEPS